MNESSADEAVTVSRRIPVFGDYEVVVVGAGPGGVGAALAAARRGRKVILIERLGFPGGVAAYGCVNLFYHMAIDGRQVAGGIADEIVRRLDALGAAWLIPPEDDTAAAAHRAARAPIGPVPIRTKVKFDIEVLVSLLHDLLSEAGVTKLFYTELGDVLTEGGRIVGVVANCREGPRVVRGRVFIDATGCAQLFHLAGVATLPAVPEKTMHKSLFFFAGGLTPHDPAENHARYRELRRAGKTPERVWPDMGQCQVTADTMQIAFGYANGDGDQSLDLARMDRELRRRNLEILEFLRKNMNGFENAHIARSAHQVCVRENRRMVGVATLTREMLHSGAPSPDPIAVIGKIYGAHGQANTDGFNSSQRSEEGGYCTIPYRALVSRDFPNALSCGKSVSVGDHILGVVRMMPTCMVTGQAAGTAAALALEAGGIALRDLPYPTLRKNLHEAGNIFEPR